MARSAPRSAFKPGQSGNPGGRPKAIKDVEAAAREHTPLAMQTLADICADAAAPVVARVSAASTLLDRGWGKSVARHVHATVTDPAQLSDAELAAIAAGGRLAPAAPVEDADDPGGVVH